MLWGRLNDLKKMWELLFRLCFFVSSPILRIQCIHQLWGFEGKQTNHPRTYTPKVFCTNTCNTFCTNSPRTFLAKTSYLQNLQSICSSGILTINQLRATRLQSFFGSTGHVTSALAVGEAEAAGKSSGYAVVLLCWLKYLPYMTYSTDYRISWSSYQIYQPYRCCVFGKHIENWCKFGFPFWSSTPSSFGEHISILWWTLFSYHSIISSEIHGKTVEKKFLHDQVKHQKCLSQHHIWTT